jgi:hypothetical protein
MAMKISCGIIVYKYKENIIEIYVKVLHKLNNSIKGYLIKEMHVVEGGLYET